MFLKMSQPRPFFFLFFILFKQHYSEKYCRLQLDSSSDRHFEGKRAYHKTTTTAQNTTYHFSYSAAPVNELQLLNCCLQAHRPHALRCPDR